MEIRRRIKHIILIFFCCWLGFPQAGDGQFPFENPMVIDQKTDLSSDYVTAIVEDRNGFMWFGTLEGLCRYDGTEVKTYKHKTQDDRSLPADYIMDLMIDRNGRLWVGTGGGIALYNPSTNDFTRLNLQDNRAGVSFEPRVNALFQDRQGEIWIGVHSLFGLFRLDGRPEVKDSFKFQVSVRDRDLDTTRLNSVTDIIQDVENDSILWLATLSGLVRFNKYNGDYRCFIYFSEDKDIQYSFNSMKKIVAGPNGLLFLGSWAGAGIFDTHTERFSRITTDIQKGALNISGKMVTSILAHSHGKIWITYNYGLLVYDALSRKVEKVFYNDPKAGKMFGAEYIDKEGRIWARTERGVYLFNPLYQQFRIQRYPTQNEDFYNIPSAAVESKDGRRLYISVTDGDGVYVFDRKEETWEVIRPPAAYRARNPAFQGQDILQLPDGRFLVLEASGLYFFREGDRLMKPLPVDFGLEAPFFRDMVLDDNNQLWIGSRRQGVFRVDLKTGTSRIYKSEFNHAGATTRFHWTERLLKDRRGNIWIRTGSGHAVYDPRRDTFLNFSYQTDDPYSSFFSIYDIIEDRKGRVWLAGDGQGLGMADPDNPERGIIKLFGPNQGYSRKAVHIQSDLRGNLWIQHGPGLGRFDPENNVYQYFDQGYGVPEYLTSLMILLSTGEMLIGIRQGFLLFHPDSLRTNREALRPYLTSFRVFDDDIFGDTCLMDLKEINLSYRQNFFSMEFSVIGYNLPEQREFAYKLEGVDENWVRAGRRNFASYTNLDGGDYIFRLKAANSEGIWNEEALMMQIHITTPFWETWWFWLTTGIFFLGGASLFIRWRLQQIQSKKVMKAEFEKRLANVELNALRAQMNPHFIFNCLNSIDYYILKNETDQASDYLNRFSRLIRLILQNSRSNNVNLRDELESLKLYIEMESLRFEEQFDYSVKIEKGLNLDEIEVPPMLLQPYVENAIWHGLVQKEGKGRLDLIITRQDGHLHCTIEDNGIGREASQALKSKTATKRKSMGMQIADDRIGMINKLYNSNASITVTDLRNGEGEALGTRVDIEIPI
jgi:ligand-binding sensor domain-containing protein